MNKFLVIKKIKKKTIKIIKNDAIYNNNIINIIKKIFLFLLMYKI